MLDRLYFWNGHLTPEAFAALEAGVLSDEDRELILAHLETCADCMNDYIATLTDDALIEPPEGLEERIMCAVRAEQPQDSPQKKRKVLAIQFMKLAVAVCLTMVLLFSGVFDFIGNTSKNLAQRNAPIKMEQQVTQRPEQEEGRFTDWMTGFRDGFNQFAKKFAFSS